MASAEGDDVLGATKEVSGGLKAAARHYEWNAATQQRKAELEALGVSTAPKPVSAAGTSAGGVTSPLPAAGASAWNAAGTWEEKDATKQAVAMLKERLLAARFPPQKGRSVVLTAVTQATGHVNRIVARGKTRVGFELQLGADWKVVEGDGSDAGAAALASGSLSIAEAADTEPDVFDSMDVRVSSATGVANGEALSLVKLCDDPLRALFRAWVEAVKA